MKLYIILVLCIIAKVNGAFKTGSELTYTDSIEGKFNYAISYRDLKSKWAINLFI